MVSSWETLSDATHIPPLPSSGDMEQLMGDVLELL